MSSQPQKKPDFQGYQIAQANFVQIPTEILWDTKDLTPELHHTLVCAAGKILWEQFRTGASRDTLIVIPLRWWMETLGLSRNAVKTRLARLEELGRLVMRDNADPQGGNLHGIRWASKDAQTSFHARRLQIRLEDITRKKQARTGLSGTPGQPADPPPPGQPTDPPPGSASGPTPQSASGPPSNNVVQDTDFNNLNQSVSQSFDDEAEQPKETPTDRRILSLLRKDGETLDPRVIEALSLVLDPPQIPRVETQSPFGSKGLWALLESVRIHGQKLGNPVGTLYNAALKPDKAAFWILRTLQPLESAGWFCQPSDYTEAATFERKRTLGALKDLQLIPLDAEGQDQHRKILKEHHAAQAAREAAWRRQIDDDEAAEEEERLEAPQPAPAPPKPVHAADIPADQASRLLALITTWRKASREAMTSKATENREGLFAASKEAWSRIIAELETVGPLLRAGPYSEVFSPSSFVLKNLNDLEKELQQ